MTSRKAVLPIFSSSYTLPPDPARSQPFSGFLCLITQELHRSAERRQSSYRPIRAPSASCLARFSTVANASSSEPLTAPYPDVGVSMAILACRGECAPVRSAGADSGQCAGGAGDDRGGRSICHAILPSGAGEWSADRLSRENGTLLKRSASTDRSDRSLPERLLGDVEKRASSGPYRSCSSGLLLEYKE